MPMSFETHRNGCRYLKIDIRENGEVPRTCLCASISVTLDLTHWRRRSLQWSGSAFPAGRNYRGGKGLGTFAKVQCSVDATIWILFSNGGSFSPLYPKGSSQLREPAVASLFFGELIQSLWELLTFRKREQHVCRAPAWFLSAL